MNGNDITEMNKCLKSNVLEQHEKKRGRGRKKEKEEIETFLMRKLLQIWQ